MGNGLPFVETNVKIGGKFTWKQPSRNSRGVQSKLLVSGYIRSQLQTSNSFQAICTVILSYYHQLHAKYISIDGIANDTQQVNAIIKRTTCFGDLIQIKYECGTPFFAVIGDNDLCPCFISDSTSKYIEIPFDICRTLDNAYEYYSKLMKHDDMMQCGIQQWSFIIHHNDRYVYSQFNGYFQSRYEPIKLTFKRNELHSFTIGLDQTHETIFYNERWKYTAKDIDEYYRIRNKKKNKLARIEILRSSDMILNCITFPSGKWEYDYKLNDGVLNECFIGPLNEQQAMIRIMHTLYGRELFESSHKHTKTDDNGGYGMHLIISFVAYAALSEIGPSRSRSVSENNMSRWDLELEDESKCMSITPAKLKQIIIKCPTRIHLYCWKLFYSTEYDGLSIHTMHNNLSDVQESILIIQDDHRNVFGAFIDCKWFNPLEKKNGKIEYNGSIDCFVFNYNDEGQLSVYPASDKAATEAPYFFRNDIKGVTIGAGECSAIYFDYNFTFGRSVHCDTYNSPPLSSAEQFKIIKVEIWGPDYKM